MSNKPSMSQCVNMADFQKKQAEYVEGLEAELKEYRNALDHIKKHYEIALPGGHKLTAAWRIANKALGK